MCTTKQTLLLGLSVAEMGVAEMVGVVFCMYSTLVPVLIAVFTISVICGGAGLAFLLFEKGIHKRLGLLLLEIIPAYALACWFGWLPGTAGFLWGIGGGMLLFLLGDVVLWLAERQALKEQSGWGCW